MSKDNAKRPIIFGEVLFDRFPDGSVVLGGAPFNVAWHLQAFGQSPLFISRVGDDPLGRRIRGAMLDWGMDCAGLQLDSAHPTGSVEVRLEGGEPQYEIVDQRAYDFVEAAALPPLSNAALIYHGSLALRGEVTRQAFHSLCARTPARRFMDVNLRPPWWRKEMLMEWLDEAAWVKLNEEELQHLTPNGKGDLQDAEALLARYTLQGLILTHGAKGAYLFDPDKAPIKVSPASKQAVVDTVGAGDAFTSVILLGLLQHWPMQSTLERAQSFASHMVGVRGATLQDKAVYERFAEKWRTSEG